MDQTLYNRVASKVDSGALLDRLPSDSEVMFDVTNVFSAKQRSYVQVPDTIHNYYYKGQKFTLGLRGSF